MRVYARTATKSATLSWIRLLMHSLTKSPNLFYDVTRKCDVMVKYRIYSFTLYQTFLIVIPRDENDYETISETWHNDVSLFCDERPMLLTDEQIEINNQIQNLRSQTFSNIFSTIAAAMYAEKRGVERHSEEMEEVLKSSQIVQARTNLEIEQEIISLKTRYKDLKQSGIFEDSFDRSIYESDRDLFRLPVKISLCKRSELCLDEFKVYGLKFHKSRFRLVHTRRPQKRNKPLNLELLNQ